jgi:hypothetical protein
MAKKSPVKALTSFHLGDRLRIKRLARQIGRIAELRGPLGPCGAPVYRVRVGRKPTVSYVELLGDQLEYLAITGHDLRHSFFVPEELGVLNRHWAVARSTHFLLEVSC